MDELIRTLETSEAMEPSPVLKTDLAFIFRHKAVLLYYAKSLIDYIVDFLTSDIPALRSCVLVCRSFNLPRACEHLFREVDIGTRHRR